MAFQRGKAIVHYITQGKPAKLTTTRELGYLAARTRNIITIQDHE